MNQMIEIKYMIGATVEYPKGEIKLIPNSRHDTFDKDGNSIQIYYKQQQLPTPNVTIGNVTKKLTEINDKWREDNIGLVWGIYKEGNINCLSVSEEFFYSEHAISFLNECDRFIKEVFHL